MDKLRTDSSNCNSKPLDVHQQVAKSSSPKTESRNIDEDDGIIFVTIKRKHSTPISKAKGTLDDVISKSHSCNLTCESMLQKKNDQGNDVLVLDTVTSVDQHCNSPCSGLENIDLEDNIEIVSVFSMNSKEYSMLPESCIQDRYDDDQVMTNVDTTGNNTPSFVDHLKNNTGTQNQNKIQCCRVPVIKSLKNNLKLTTNDGHSLLNQKCEIRQSPEKTVSCFNEVRYSSNSDKSLNEESNSSSTYKNNTVYRKIYNFLFEKQEENEKQIGFPISTNKGYSKSSEAKAQNKSIRFDEKIALDSDMPKNNHAGSQESIFVHNSKNCTDIQDENERKIQFCNLPVVKEIKNCVKNTEDGKSEVRHSPIFEKGEVRNSSINEVGYFSKSNKLLTEASNFSNSYEDRSVSGKISESVFEIKIERKNDIHNRFPNADIEHNWPSEARAQSKFCSHFASADNEVMMDVNTTENNSPSPNQPMFADNSKDNTDTEDENQTNIQRYSLRDIKKMKLGAKPAETDRQNLAKERREFKNRNFKAYILESQVVVQKQAEALLCQMCKRAFHKKFKMPSESNSYLFECKSCSFSTTRKVAFKRHKIVSCPKKKVKT